MYPEVVGIGMMGSAWGGIVSGIRCRAPGENSVDEAQECRILLHA